MSKIIKIFFFILGISGAVVLWVSYSNIFLAIDDEENSEMILDVKPGTSLGRLSKDLFEMGLIKNPDIFYYYVRGFAKGKVVKAGEYSVKKSMSAAEIWSVISSGHSMDRVFTIREGLNSFEIAQIFEKSGFGSADEFLKLVFDKDFAGKLTGVEAFSLEGYLFPDTYKFNKYIGTKELISVLVNRAVKIIQEVRRLTPTKMTIPTMVTMASIIEKETGNPSERVLISSVIHNRLAKGMKLQMDPTVIYGYWRKTGKYIENIRRKDLLEPNDYNTYTFYGLPVGPISNPGKESLYAALNPEKTGYLYFVSKNEGSHIFSETLKDHNKAVGTFQLDQKNRQGKSWRDLKKKSKIKPTVKR
ncbi:MAG: hypothetical protein A4S09_08565 [Proteobacteria bacterium SG_bin7]|nr:MAG: hypothetical protein A4S09_08565 [Proteobacteria bacterium SG_bin7]